MNWKINTGEGIIDFCLDELSKRASVTDKDKLTNGHQMEAVKLARFLVEVQRGSSRLHEGFAYVIGALIGSAATIIFQAILS